VRGNGQRDESLFRNPVLIGALTVLFALVAVTLAYQANNGLPFVPRYELHVQVTNASELTHGTEVHMGGTLVGLVTSVEPTRDARGNPVAQLNLSLEKKIEPLPVDSTFIIRLKGAIGLKYLDVTPGRSRRTWPNGAVVPDIHSGATVDLDKVLSMFNLPTRLGVRQATIGFSDALAGRGAGINDAIGAFVPLVTDLGPVMRNLGSPRTDIGGFFHGLERFSAAVAPVARTQATLYTNLDVTFRALASVAVPYLQQWISQTPPTFATVIADAPRIGAFVNNTAGLFSELRPGFATLHESAPVFADAFAAGAKNLPGSVALDQRLLTLSRTLNSFGTNPAVTAGLNRLTLTAHSLRAPLSFLTPVQSTCNYVSLFLRNIASLLDERVGTGTVLRFNLVTIDDIPGAESVPSQRPFLTPNTNPSNEHGPLHVNAYPYTASPGQPNVCAAGNEPYSGKRASIGNPSQFLGTRTETTTRPKG
jgi:ABC-type transporter Mla subunit MlaD